ncbi:hypothetical protein MOQ_009147 [Trypanosoma cruzi marinkellei]|uniref:Uncharacterized protein n=1 Tax=Trypanosoma cruzi marinkellei TaxID=85056 RepID=K2MXU9_TRYCR|nr:hypothetical protein MOQ_009147 [Trypanosoma cruzi marinkellei]
MEFRVARAVLFGVAFSPPPSVGADVPFDARSYRLRAYPFYDAPNPPEFVERLLKDRGVIPDPPVETTEPPNDSEEAMIQRAAIINSISTIIFLPLFFYLVSFVNRMVTRRILYLDEYVS